MFSQINYYILVVCCHDTKKKIFYFLILCYIVNFVKKNMFLPYMSNELDINKTERGFSCEWTRKISIHWTDNNIQNGSDNNTNLEFQIHFTAKPDVSLSIHSLCLMNIEENDHIWMIIILW
jgi:hypothetical protein